MSIEQRYVLVVAGRSKTPPQDFEEAAGTLAALFEEGHKTVSLLVLIEREATQAEMWEVAHRAQKILQEGERNEEVPCD